MLIAAEISGLVALICFVIFYVILPFYLKTEKIYLDHISEILAGLFFFCGIFAIFFGLMNLIK